MKSLEKNKPLVSVIVPVYNVEQYIARCIDSIINQTYSNLEIIIVSDATPDKSVEIIKKYMQKDRRIKLIELTKNGGLFNARAVGMSKMNGEYFTLVDSDDWVSEDYICNLLDKALLSDADIVVSGGFTMAYENGSKKAITRSCTLRSPDVFDNFIKDMASKKLNWTVWGKIYKKILYEKSKKYIKKVDKYITVGEDIIYTSFFAYSSKKVQSVKNEFGYHYFQNATSSTKISSRDAYVKKLSNLDNAFFEFEKFLTTVSLYDKYKKELSEFIVWQIGEHVELIRDEYINIIQQKDIEIDNLKLELKQKNLQLDKLMSIKGSARQLSKNVKRRITKSKPSIIT